MTRILEFFIYLPPKYNLNFAPNIEKKYNSISVLFEDVEYLHSMDTNWYTHQQIKNHVHSHALSTICFSTSLPTFH